MDRRAFLSTGVAVVLAGCSNSETGDGTQTTAATTRSLTGTAGSTATATDATAGSTTATGTAEPTATETAEPTATRTATDSDPPTTTANSAVSDIDIAVISSEWNSGDDEVKVTVTNQDENDPGSAEIVVKWFDDQGHYLGQDTASLLALGAGKSWEVDIPHSMPYDPSSFEVTAHGSRLPSSTPDGFEVEITESNSQDVEGLLRNTTNDEADATVIAIGYDAWYVGYTGLVEAAGIPANKTWQFKAPLSRVTSRYTNMNEAQVVVL